MRALCRLTALWMLTLLSPLVHAQLYVPPDEILQSVPVIAVLPSFVPPDMEGAETATASIDKELAAALTKAGFKVHGVDVYQTIENEYSRLAGGWFDPLTGAIKEPVRNVIVDRTIEALLERHQVQGFVRAHVDRQQVPFTDAKRVAWDGVVEDVIKKEGLFATLDRSLGIRDEGRILVMSLKVQIFDGRARPIYDAAGGIAAMSVLANKKFVAVDVSAVLNDLGRLQRAVGVITGPLTHKGAAEPVRQFSGTGTSKRTFRSTLPVAADEALPVSAPAAQIKQNVMTIALTPMDAIWHPQAEMVKTRYDKQLSDTLTKAGFRVLPATAYASTAEAAAREVGGTYDAITGKLVPEKAKAAEEILRRRLKDEHAVDAILTPKIEIVAARHDLSGEATWDGASQSVFATPAGWNGKPYIGMQSALSLSVRLDDVSGQHLYSRRGGIELISLFINGGFERRPHEQLLLDETKAARAMELALAGMTGV